VGDGEEEREDLLMRVGAIALMEILVIEAKDVDVWMENDLNGSKTISSSKNCDEI
jgi:hypothetical protein